jgi:hypothetical protein
VVLRNVDPTAALQSVTTQKTSTWNLTQGIWQPAEIEAGTSLIKSMLSSNVWCDNVLRLLVTISHLKSEFAAADVWHLAFSEAYMLWRLLSRKYGNECL